MIMRTNQNIVVTMKSSHHVLKKDHVLWQWQIVLLDFMPNLVLHLVKNFVFEFLVCGHLLSGVSSWDLSTQWHGKVISFAEASSLQSTVHSECSKSPKCEIKVLKKGVMYYMKEGGEGHYGVINACIRWEHWQADQKRKIQDMSSTRDTCAIDTAKHVADLRN
jgi:hypothetical protein